VDVNFCKILRRFEKMRVTNRSPMVLMVVSKGVSVALYPGQEIEVDMPNPHNQRLLQGGLIKEVVVRVSSVPIEVKKGPQRNAADEVVSSKEVRAEVRAEETVEKSAKIEGKKVSVKKGRTRRG
jgi:hypothetical protein